MTEYADVAPPIVDTLRSICFGLPEAREEAAWIGTRWRIRSRTFAHVLVVDSAHPPAYAHAAQTNGPATVLMFRSSGAELEALRTMGRPFFAPVWRADEVGMLLETNVDWVEVTELLTESYCLLAPKALAGLVKRPAD